MVEQSEVGSLTIHDDLVVTAHSTVQLLRDACRWFVIFEAASTFKISLAQEELGRSCTGTVPIITV